MENFYSIQQTAGIIRVNKETLRRWDKSGKFPSQRNPMNNYRVYSKEQVNNPINDLLLPYGTMEMGTTLGQPYFSTELGDLYIHDVIRFFRRIDSKSIDLIFADPPYNIKKAEGDTFHSQNNM